MEKKKNNGNVRVAQILSGARADEGLTRSEAAAKSGVPERYIAFFEGDLKSGVTADVLLETSWLNTATFYDLILKQLLRPIEMNNNFFLLHQLNSHRVYVVIHLPIYLLPSY